MDTASWQERRDMMNRIFQEQPKIFDIVKQTAENLLPTLNALQRAEADQSLPGALRPPA
jgi:hypothetical protein